MAGQGFADPVIGGGGQIVVPVIKSPNFNQVAQTGWAIMSNGDAFFYNITAEGSVTSTTVVIAGTGEGLFMYSGAPANGNLLLSAAAASGTDQFGNAYVGPGISLSVPGGAQNIVQVRPDLAGIFVYAA